MRGLASTQGRQRTQHRQGASLLCRRPHLVLFLDSSCRLRLALLRRLVRIRVRGAPPAQPLLQHVGQQRHRGGRGAAVEERLCHTHQQLLPGVAGLRGHRGAEQQVAQLVQVARRFPHRLVCGG